MHDSDTLNPMAVQGGGEPSLPTRATSRGNAVRPATGVRHHLWCFIRQWPATQALWLLMAALAISLTLLGREHDAWIAASAFGLAVLPVALEGLTQIRVPRGFVLGVGLYVVPTVVLGELSDFYQRFAWWDVAMHLVAGAALLALGLVIALTFAARHGATLGIALPAMFAAFFTLGIAALWELFEYALDARFGFSTQNASLPDTMHDIALGGVGALPVLTLSVLHLAGRRTSGFGRAVDDAVAENVTK